MEMGPSRFICEIVESKDESNLVYTSDGSSVPNFKLKEHEIDRGSCSYMEDELNQLIKAIDLKGTRRVVGPSRQKGADILGKSTLKKPVKVRISQSSGIGTADSVTLKQALRKLCISQASEMAAVKRLSKPIGVLGPDSGCIQKLYASVVVQARDSGHPLDGGHNLVEVSVVPKKVAIDSSVKATELSKDSKPHSFQLPSKIVITSSHCTVSTKAGASKTSIQDMIKTESSDIDDNSSAAAGVGIEGGKTSEMSISNSKTLAEPGKTCKISFPVKLVKHKSCVIKKGKRESTLANNTSNKCGKINRVDAVSFKTKVAQQKSSVFSGFKGKSIHGESGKKNKYCCGTYPDSTPNSCNNGRTVCEKTSGISRLREKGECSQSSKSSLGDYRSSTSISDESHQSGSSGNGSRPHMSKDVRWISIHSVLMQHGSLGLKNFKLLKRLGCGDIGTVYLAELIGSECLFALKVMDIGYLVSRKKMLRAQTEREILQMLDHPFLPTLYAHFTTENLSCLVMEYCSGGDLHVLRQKQVGRSFSEPAARFYVAEVLLALEYLHMLGVVYRDLKPENILVREDGHIMLSDFDLSLRCTVSATLLRSLSYGTQEPTKKLSGPCPENSCIDPRCLQPSWVHASCFSPRIVSSTVAKNRKQKSDLNGQVRQLPQLVVEPTDARSNSFVGTHEYLAPEIIRGDGHGSAVDWWTFGIFLFELLFGRTPFKGPGNEETMANVVSQSLRFPENPSVSLHARDLIGGLLIKEPENRLGSVRGAAEIKKHPFFEGLNWALIRCTAPPETPRNIDVGAPVVMPKKKDGKCVDFRSNGEDVEFELF